MAAEARLAALRHDWRRAIALGDSAIAIVLDPATVGLVGEAWAALGDTARAATSDEVKELRREAQALKEAVADLTLENRLLKKSMLADGEDGA